MSISSAAMHGFAGAYPAAPLSAVSIRRALRLLPSGALEFLAFQAAATLAIVTLAGFAGGSLVASTIVLLAAQCGFSLAFALRMMRRRADSHARLLKKCDELIRANSDLYRLSVTDALTCITNRRGFDTALPIEWARAQRERGEISLILIDADLFKSFNDRFGHPEGDRCLRLLAEAIEGAVSRPTDLVARLGGEEFAVLLPGTGAYGAADIAERITRRVAALGLDHPENPAGHVTISAGVATLVPPAAERSQRLVEAADQALYDAKRAGRNRVVTARVAHIPLWEGCC